MRAIDLKWVAFTGSAVGLALSFSLMLRRDMPPATTLPEFHFPQKIEPLSDRPKRINRQYGAFTMPYAPQDLPAFDVLWSENIGAEFAYTMNEKISKLRDAKTSARRDVAINEMRSAVAQTADKIKSQIEDARYLDQHYKEESRYIIQSYERMVADFGQMQRVLIDLKSRESVRSIDDMVKIVGMLIGIISSIGVAFTAWLSYAKYKIDHQKHLIELKENAAPKFPAQ